MNYKYVLHLLALVVLACVPSPAAEPSSPNVVLNDTKLRDYVARFNTDDEELYANISNEEAFDFLDRNIPLFECPDPDIERTYYFRWWTYRKHVKETPDGWVITEFLPQVTWSAKHNTISCPAGHHFYEGRWLRDGKYMNDYAVFWFRKGGSPRRYSFWAADAMYARYLVNGDKELVTDLLDDLVANYEAWERERLCADGMFWQIDDRDGMEVSVGGSGKRPTINSYMFGDAVAISRIAKMAGRDDVAREFQAKGLRLRKLVQEKLWDPEAAFFKMLPRSRYEVVTPRDSRGNWVPKLHWMDKDHLGTLEWVQYSFEKPKSFDSVEVYWAGDGHGIVPPASWRILVRQGDNWTPVKHRGLYGTALNGINRVEFTAVETDAIRMEMQSPEGKSGGILEWRTLGGGVNHAPGAKISKSFQQRGMLNKVEALRDGEGASREAELVDVREQHGFTPWYFHLPESGKGYEVAWKQLMDPKGFHAPFGPTTAEQRHPEFKISYEGHECQWNGPSWPLATSITLTALANVLNDYPQQTVSKTDYFQTLKIYTKSHRLTRDDRTVVPWIDENLNPHTGDWVARTRLKSWKNGTWDPGKGGKERGKDYNHSSYCDLIITGLVGLRPRADDLVEVHPLLPADTWDYFCLDGVPYHGRLLTILYDKTGKTYGRGSGLRILSNGKEIGATETLGRLTARLPKN